MRRPQPLAPPVVQQPEDEERHGLVGAEIALCSACGEVLGRQIVETYKALERFAEGARFLEEFGKMDEAFELLAEIKG